MQIMQGSASAAVHGSGRGSSPIPFWLLVGQNDTITVVSLPAGKRDLDVVADGLGPGTVTRVLACAMFVLFFFHGAPGDPEKGGAWTSALLGPASS